MTLAPGGQPEYGAFDNGLSGFDKKAFKRFRHLHPTQTNHGAMWMFKINYGHFQLMGILHGL